MSAASASVLLNRILTLRESSPFLLVLDPSIQSSANLTKELIYKVKTSRQEIGILYVSFETVTKPDYAEEFIDALDKPMDKIVGEIFKIIGDKEQRRLIIVDSFNYIKDIDLNRLLRAIIDPQNVIYGAYHLDIPAPRSSSQPNKPSTLSILRFIATSVFELSPMTTGEWDDMLGYLDIPVNVCNRNTFKVKLTFRRKSGRALEYELSVDTTTHEYKQIVKKREDSQKKDEEEMLRNLTTFNLNTSRRQKKAREQVELPFMEAQKSLGSVAGSTVYEFDRDDDYDEEDPYEDPI
ncbi:DEKNAAC101571 [Brettanomyces naardenensis]|uniref:Elongator complex protein 5 n=1 Tax=Brettanomyces naardenensis TaxID=13370 RepID=A0A448YIQ0_BRENA|nr:DEKNAAC101571 [Brettanomyces naardenensis]